MSAGMIVLGVIVGIFTLLIIITIHELGHFIVAKISKAYVYEFSIGFGPKLFSIKTKETWVTFRAIPLGGYCSIASDKVDPPKGREKEVIPDERKLDYIARWKKMFFILAGPFINLIFALLLFTLIFAIVQHKKNDMTYFGATYDQDKYAAKAIYDNETNINYVGQEFVLWGFRLTSNERNGDNPIFDNICENINNDSCSDAINYKDNDKATSYSKTVYNFIDNLKKVEDSDTNVEISFSYKIVDKYTGVALHSDLKITKKTHYKKGDTVGISPPTRLYKTSSEAYGAGWVETFNSSVMFLKAIGNIFVGNFSGLAGPVGVAKQSAQVLNSAEDYFLFAASISANLFIFNLLFFPPLDGYRLIENFFEMITKKELSLKYKIIVNTIGFVVFLLLIIAVTIKDFIG
ncbi:M50 family metallopeptidase [Spiroplasma turonicum]|uniref:Inner membrane zinc metalloprotease n=1 Tax=Spiroplasma turonicum TaxID=216946 RepID=A0A0K1P5D7_9MOLU|nr:M50 family metallopeptidase [Spiroplasma turonicum]AKU79511.1 inner membrane zinc metalloprotease [Spiroplasma turonicum]ALX70534.1 inner membrane zinc metalloprotease [Spiroplasma turonicum]